MLFNTLEITSDMCKDWNIRQRLFYSNAVYELLLRWGYKE